MGLIEDVARHMGSNEKGGFNPQLFSLRRPITAEGIRANIDLKSAFLEERGQFGPKFQVQEVVFH